MGIRKRRKIAKCKECTPNAPKGSGSVFRLEWHWADGGKDVQLWTCQNCGFQKPFKKREPSPQAVEKTMERIKKAILSDPKTKIQKWEVKESGYDSIKDVYLTIVTYEGEKGSNWAYLTKRWIGFSVTPFGGFRAYHDSKNESPKSVEKMIRNGYYWS